jgi:hypothetical protein
MRELTAIDSRSYVVAFEFRQGAGCPPDFHLPPAAARFDEGVFVPRGDKDWLGRYAWPPRVLLLSGDEFWVVTHPSANEAPCGRAIDRISFAESGHMLLRGWLGFRGAGFDCTVRYNTRGHPSVLGFMRHFRNRWLGAARPAPSEVALGDALDMRFANALADELDPGESVGTRFFQLPRQLKGHWPLRRSQWIPGDLLAVTSSRLLWLTDRDRGSRAQYGGIASYAPLHAPLRLSLVSRPGGCHFEVHSGGVPPWVIPVAAERRRDAESFVAAPLQGPIATLSA